jgi:hypothetical protein
MVHIVNVCGAVIRIKPELSNSKTTFDIIYTKNSHENYPYFQHTETKYWHYEPTNNSLNLTSEWQPSCGIPSSELFHVDRTEYVILLYKNCKADLNQNLHFNLLPNFT